MENLFSATMYWIFGKRWVLYSMKTGLKVAVFINEVEVEMNKQAHRNAIRDRDRYEKEMEALLNAPEDERLPKDEYKNRKKFLEDSIAGAKEQVDQKSIELQQANQIAFKSRNKLDFIRNYKITRSYGDVPQGKFEYQPQPKK